MPTLGQLLRWHRTANEMTGAQVAAAMEISASTISRWENDLQSPTIVDLRVLAMVLGIDDYWNLLKDEEQDGAA